MPEWSHFPRHRRQTLHLVPAVRLRPLRHKTGSHWSSLAFLQQRRKLPEQRAELASLSVLPFFPGVSRSLGTWNLPVFLLTVTCRPRLSPANHLSSSRPCTVFKLLQDPRSLRRATHPPEPIPCPGRLHTHLNQSRARGSLSCLQWRHPSVSAGDQSWDPGLLKSLM